MPRVEIDSDSEYYLNYYERKKSRQIVKKDKKKLSSSINKNSGKWNQVETKLYF